MLDRYMREALDRHITTEPDEFTWTPPVCDHAHEGPHVLLWAAPWHGTRVRGHEVIERAVRHAAAEVDEADLLAVDNLLDRARRLTGNRRGAVTFTDDEYRAAERVIEPAAEYMTENGYAADPDSEIATTAALLGDGSIALVCWADRLPEPDEHPGWSAAAPIEIGPGQVVTRWTHPSGAIVDDNRENLPPDLVADLGDRATELLAEEAFVGHRPEGRCGEFPSFEQAADYALGRIS